MKGERKYPLLSVALMLAMLSSLMVAVGEPSPNGQAGAMNDLPTEFETQDAPCDPGWIRHLGKACQVDEHRYAVFLEDGTVLYTHGPDPVPPPDHGLATGLGEGNRQPVCATTNAIHVLYGRPHSRPDRYHEVKESLQDIVVRMNTALNQDALDSGHITADYRVRCDGSGEIAVGHFVGPGTGGENYVTEFSGVVTAARSHGFTQTRVNYLIFYDSSSAYVCGVGNFQYDESLSPHNRNLAGPDYGITYENCWSGRTPMHENGHNMGAVQRSAPMSDGSAHCLEGGDVMCYSYPTSLVFRCFTRNHFDCNHDTYFHTDPPDGSWLANHWNLGSRLNVYLEFGRGDPDEPDDFLKLPDSDEDEEDPEDEKKENGGEESGIGQEEDLDEDEGSTDNAENETGGPDPEAQPEGDPDGDGSTGENDGEEDASSDPENQGLPFFDDQRGESPDWTYDGSWPGNWWIDPTTRNDQMSKESGDPSEIDDGQGDEESTVSRDAKPDPMAPGPDVRVSKERRSVPFTSLPVILITSLIFLGGVSRRTLIFHHRQ